MDSDLNTLSDHVHQVETRFNKLRDEIISKLYECSDCIKSTKQLCHETTERNKILENKLLNASYEEQEWKDFKVKLAKTSANGMIILNVGGEKYTTNVETLTREKNTFFTTLFSEQWQIERDPDDKSIFIDRNGKIFAHILEYYRTNIVPDYVMNDKSLVESLIIEAEYYRLHSLLEKLGVVYFPNGSLLELAHQKKLNKFYGEIYQRWELIYKASHDGFDANAFHSRCNHQGPTMTIIKSKDNYLFGGYTAIPWTSDISYKNDTSAFLFTLTNPYNIPSTKYLINPAHTEYAVSHHSKYGPTFGGGHDVHLANGSNANNNSYVNFPYSYLDTTSKGNNTFTGARNFTASDIEVFKLV